MLEDTDIGRRDTLDSELPADDALADLHGLVGDVHGLLDASARETPCISQTGNSFGLSLGAVDFLAGPMGTNGIESLAGQDFQVAVPDGIETAGIMGDYIIMCPTDDDLLALQADLVPFVEGIDHDADDLSAISEVNLCGLALASSHAGRVDGITLADVLGHDLGKSLVDVCVLHNLYPFRPVACRVLYCAFIINHFQFIVNNKLNFFWIIC